MNTPKSPMVAFLLGFIPGLSHLYLNRFLKAFLYGGAFFGSILLFLVIASNGGVDEAAMIVFFLGVLIWIVNMIDTIYSATRRVPPMPPQAYSGYTPEAGEPYYGAHYTPYTGQQDLRFKMLLLSIIPGLGQFQLGLMQRGLSLIVSFFGLIVMVLFVSAVTNVDGFLVFLGILPILWLYSLYDSIQQLNRKERGESLVDRTIFDDFQENRESGHKNKTIALILSVFPGAGHMYLGLQKRGLQLMAIFLFSMYVMDAMRLTLFLFLIPIIWFYSFFDAMQAVSKHGREPLEDIPVVVWLMNHHKWAGYGLLALGLYFLFEQVGVQFLRKWFPDHNIMFMLDTYLQVFIVSVVLIGGGLTLITGSFRRKGGDR